MAPPGRPNMTSTPCISRLLMSACAPVSASFIWVVPLFGSLGAACGGRGWIGPELKRPPGREVERRALGIVGARLRYEYQNLGTSAACLHEPLIVACPPGSDNPRGAAAPRPGGDRRPLPG